VVRSKPDWAGLRERLSGDLVLPRSDGYESARKPFIARFDSIEPQAIARCSTAEDVVAVITFAGRCGLEVAPRSGGHCLAGYSSTRGVVIDVSAMDAVTVADGVVRVGAGVRTGQLCDRLCAHGLAIPMGTCPSVGIAGLTLGGGIGVLGRAYGLTLDHLLAAQLVLADGRVLECDEHHDPDLFWALRGAGGRNFGVVTSFTFAPRPANALANFRLVWAFRHAAAVIFAWQSWAPGGPDELSADLVLTANNSSSDPTVEVYGALIGSERDARGLLNEFTAQVRATPESLVCRRLSYRDTCIYQAELSVAYDQHENSTSGPVRRQGYRLTKSELFARPLPTEAIAALVDTFDAGRAPGQSRSVGFAPWGGAYNRRSPTATAFAHRDELLSVEHIVIVDPAAPDADKHAAHTWVTRSWESIRRWGSGRVYPCFPDAELADWGRAYYGDNYARLRAIKATYDPRNVFRFTQSLPLP
jgi:FAD/FMN-containing dehydrogenase